MERIEIRNLAEAVLVALRRRAVAFGTSTEEQARRALARAIGLDRQTALDQLDKIRAMIRVDGPGIVEDLRRDRRRNEP
jgi:plasmid stability protein